jgi:hypothetical protein
VVPAIVAHVLGGAHDEADRLSGGSARPSKRIETAVGVAQGAVGAGVDVFAQDARGPDLPRLVAAQIDARLPSQRADEYAILSCRRHDRDKCLLDLAADFETNQILVPGTADCAARDARAVKTQQHALGVELRISDRQSWHASELKGESHHDAYRFRQLLALMNRLFRRSFDFSSDALVQLRKDQGRVFA